MKILRTFGNSNPAGITINEGYIALLACICSDMSGEEALHRVCGLPLGGISRKRPGIGKSDLILQATAENPGLNNSEIARRVGCTREMVRYVLKKKTKKQKKAGNKR